MFACGCGVTLTAEYVLESQFTMLQGATELLLHLYTYKHLVRGIDTGQRGVSEALACGCRVG